MKRKILALAIAGCLGAVSAEAQEVVEIWECEGATFADGYAVDVTVTDPYYGIWYQVEDDADSLCEDFKNENPDFACNKKGDGNLVTSRIDDDNDPLMPKDFDQSNSGASMSVPGSEVAGDPTYAMVHADVFQPGECAAVFQCDDDNDAETPDVDCYDSGFGGGDLYGGYFDNSYDSCAEAFDETSEGFWAELNEGGGMISPNRNPKKTNNMNWAMYVELSATCDQTIEVDTDGVDGEATEDAPTCDTVSVTRDGIVDGGDYFVDGGTVGGSVTFTPTTQCTATWVCDDDGEGSCPD